MESLNLGEPVERNPSKIDWLKVRRNQYVVLAVVLTVIVIFVITAFVNRSNNSNNNTTAQSNPVIDSYKSKIPELESKLNVNPNDTNAIHDLAIALYATGDIQGAKDNYLKEAELNPNNPVLFNNLGNVYRDSNEYQKAVDAYKKSIDLDKRQTNAYLNLANLYLYTMNQAESGLEVLNSAIANNPDNAEVMYMQLGNSYTVLNNKDSARDAFNKVLEINPGNTAAQNALKNL